MFYDESRCWFSTKKFKKEGQPGVSNNTSRMCIFTRLMKTTSFSSKSFFEQNKVKFKNQNFEWIYLWFSETEYWFSSNNQGYLININK